MNDYRTYVQSLARLADASQTILNRSPLHASIIVAAVFGATQRRVEILTGDLRNDIYGTPEVLEAAKNYLARNPEARLEIISEDGLTPQASILLTSLQKQPLLSSRVSFGRCSDHQAKMHKFRFIVGDGQHYRFQSDPNNTEAVVQFGRTETGRKLHEIFVKLAEHVPLTSLASSVITPPSA